MVPVNSHGSANVHQDGVECSAMYANFLNKLPWTSTRRRYQMTLFHKTPGVEAAEV